MKTFIIVLIIVVLAVAGYFLWRGQASDNLVLSPSPSASLSPTASASVSPSASSSPANSTASTVKNITVDGRSFSFNPSTITVNKGDTVNLTFMDEGGNHNLFIEGYNLKTATISGGQSQTLHFVADKTGTFQFYCTVDSHRELGMVGTLTVK
ncbi:MAG TPA: plastocyanin/azurin family copper-binding protein [Candidatus Paceibacterota bacterium]|nr:plastocyanin/azurin family copper-binding protein [Candidatus Paceibacterota bacterium]